MPEWLSTNAVAAWIATSVGFLVGILKYSYEINRVTKEILDIQKTTTGGISSMVAIQEQTQRLIVENTHALRELSYYIRLLVEEQTGHPVPPRSLTK